MEIEPVHPVFEPLLRIIARQSRGGYEWTPSERDIEIYKAVTIHNRPQREVAEKHELSQTRVRQLLDQVGKWLAERLPQRHADLPREERLNLAVYIERERLDYLYGQAVVGWENSLRPQATFKTRETKDGPMEERIVRNTSGRPQYLREAARLTRDLAALEGVVPATYVREVRRTWSEEELSVDRLTLEQQEARLVWMEEGLKLRQQYNAARFAELAAADAGDQAAKEKTRDYDRAELLRDKNLNEYLRNTLPEQWQEFRKKVAAARAAGELASPEEDCSTKTENAAGDAPYAGVHSEASPTQAETSESGDERKSQPPADEKQLKNPAQTGCAATAAKPARPDEMKCEAASEPTQVKQLPTPKIDPSLLPSMTVTYYEQPRGNAGGPGPLTPPPGQQSFERPPDEGGKR